MFNGRIFRAVRNISDPDLAFYLLVEDLVDYRKELTRSSKWYRLFKRKGVLRTMHHFYKLSLRLSKRI